MCMNIKKKCTNYNVHILVFIWIVLAEYLLHVNICLLQKIYYKNYDLI